MKRSSSSFDLPTCETSSKGGSWIEIGLIWVGLVSWSLLRIPIPGVNEPHYLSKARHWWNPDWAAGDFFLDSSNPHQVFYATFGWLTGFLSLPQAAVIGRVVGLLILALGWNRLARSVTGRRCAGLLALPVFLLLQSLGNFSGEWLVGGIESKVPAYGFLFWAIGSLLTGKWLSASIAAGLAVSFHPLVGMWGVISGGMAVAIRWGLSRYRTSRGSAGAAPELQLPGAKTAFVAGLLFVVTSLPGLIPAVQSQQTPDADTERIANKLQVADRLAHHLDPMQFSKAAYRYGGLLLILWLVIESRLPRTPQNTWWRTYVLCTVLLILAGIVIGWGPRPVTQMWGHIWRLKLLKFYFFRLGDVMVPVALSLAAVDAALTWLQESSQLGRRLALAAVGVLVVAGALSVPFPDANPSRMSSERMADWTDACNWLREHNSTGKLAQVTETGWALRWFSESPEYVNFKDMPQDPASVLEWNRRLWVLARWRNAALEDGIVTAQELSDLRQKTDIEFLICHRFGPIDVPPDYQNKTFRIYRLKHITPESKTDEPQSPDRSQGKTSSGS